jgi:hypothetical protein
LGGDKVKKLDAFSGLSQHLDTRPLQQAHQARSEERGVVADDYSHGMSA